MDDYRPPELIDLGSLHDLTLATKVAGEDDGVMFDPSSIGLQGPPISIGVAS
jgi:hypothetical protein